MYAQMSKGDYEAKQKMEKKENERKKNILILITKYLNSAGYSESSLKLEEETGLDIDSYDVADNIDLYLIVREYEDYYYMKFNKYPKFVSKINDYNAKIQGLPKVGPKSSCTKRPNQRKKLESINAANIKQIGNNQNNNLQNKSTVNQINPEGDLKLELNINPMIIQPKGKMKNNSVNNLNAQSKSGEEEIYSFNDHKESILLKNLPPDMPEELKELALLIKREIILENPNVCFKDIVGLDTPKSIIEEALLWPIKYPQFFTGLLEPWKGILLFGPPGTGKTLLAKAVATEMRSTFFNISAATVVSKWRGDSEKIIKVLFDLARYYQPSTIFLDEIDSIMSSRGSSQDEHEGSRRMKTELLIQLDGLNKNEGVFLLAASNVPWDLDQALLRRLEKRVIVNLPDKEARCIMLKNFLPLNRCKGIDYEKFSELLEGYSGSDVRLVCKEALMIKTRKAIKIIEAGDKNKIFQPNDFPVEKEDLEEAFNKVKPAFSYKTEEYEKWFKEFGSA
ncbi:MAG: AAA family ATPase [archaeon]|nr:AAA family ATPase [archaeon]